MRFVQVPLYPCFRLVYPGVMRSADDTSTNGPNDRLTTVVEAAEILGITPDAVRSRLRRGTLKRSPKRGEEGEVLVILPASRNGNQSIDRSATVYDQPSDQSATDRCSAELVECMSSEIDHLRTQLDEANSANRENRRIIAGLVQRVPELEAHTEEREAPETATPRSDGGTAPEDSHEPTERRSWLYRFFFGP